MPPHLGARKIMSVAVHAPHPAAHFGVEDDPIRRVHPIPGDSRSGAGPRDTIVFTAEESDIGVGNELASCIKRVEMNSVAGSNVKTKAGPAGVIYFAGIDRYPRSTSVNRPHGSSKVRRICQIGILLSYRKG